MNCRRACSRQTQVLFVITRRIRMARDHDQPAWLGLDVCKCIHQKLGRSWLQLRATTVEERQAVQANRAWLVRHSLRHRRDVMAVDCGQQRRTQPFALIEPDPQRPRFPLAIVAVQSLRILAKHHQCLLTLRYFVRIGAQRSRAVASQIIGDLTDQERVLPRRTNQRNASRQYEQPDSNHHSPASPTVWSTARQHMEQCIRKG
ncbi:hypothetical protein D3C81_1074940 [compost metagenome]